MDGYKVGNSKKVDERMQHYDTITNKNHKTNLAATLFRRAVGGRTMLLSKQRTLKWKCRRTSWDRQMNKIFFKHTVSSTL